MDVCYYKALAQYKSGDTKAAIKTYDGLVDYDKKNWEVYYLRGSVLLADGQPDACLKDYDKAVSLNDSDAELYGHISENLQNAGRTQEAQKYLEQGLKLKPSSASFTKTPNGSLSKIVLINPCNESCFCEIGRMSFPP